MMSRNIQRRINYFNFLCQKHKNLNTRGRIWQKCGLEKVCNSVYSSFLHCLSLYRYICTKGKTMDVILYWKWRRRLKSFMLQLSREHQLHMKNSEPFWWILMMFVWSKWKKKIKATHSNAVELSRQGMSLALTTEL